MTNIVYTTDKFQNQGISLNEPITIKDYNFSEITVNGESLFVQLCETHIGNGICNNKNGDPYVDLLINEESEDTLEWFDNFDQSLKKLLVLNSDQWFDDEITNDDIEESFNASLNSDDDDNHFTFRVYLPKNYKIKSNLNIYDENGDSLKSSILKEDDITIVPLVEIKGIKFDSDEFSLYGVLRQAMVVDDDEESDEESEGESDEESDEEIKRDSKTETEDTNKQGISLNVEQIASHNKHDLELDELEEVNLDASDLVEDNKLHLKKTSEVYLSMWRDAREKAKNAKNEAIKAYLEAQNIKSTWLLDEVDEDDDDVEDIKLLLEKENGKKSSIEPLGF